ncbi:MULTISPECIES: DUF7333 family protein [Haloarcula]|uniref:Uncharacterized protein n=3 Tax=Haloarcula hispanica TaxID=51589 RepID=A0A482TGZ6_HALHI|nr:MULTISPECIES: hypothetical protein [Haloarcula]AEM56194.1 conserved hypothetical protein [Haloarcula hispanica ATCC 33960]AHB65006.1 hypothetical protein HISP_02950 [Haloarcula hispanica N601]AJF26164.1 hypothetical protein SG26_10720 [Haloarcula sp. CBA1115]KAA9408024.1 hypothetical protein Har1131_14805 [Haloarcula sp. CBA1131]KAA9408928.1 hypothetical protein EGO51_03705 [Haloarcula hispanica]
MEFDTTKTAIAFLVLVGVMVSGSFMGMPSSIALPVSVGQIVVFALILALGVKHGEYRATR